MLLRLCLCFSTLVFSGLVLAAEKPNLLLIVADDMGYGDLSCYGSKQVPTPHLDELAANGVRCTDGYVSAPVCAPSRAGLMTGRYQNRIGFEHNLSIPSHLKPEMAGIDIKQPLISDRLKAAGYATGIIGKWHLGASIPEHHPNERGFDHFFGMLGGSHSYWPTVEKNKLSVNEGTIESVRTPYLTDWFTLEAGDFIETHTKADKPWFLYLSYNTPHGPMQAKDEDLEKFQHIHDKTRRLYCAMQHNMDQNIGSLIERLKTLGALEDTLLVFISDNGGSVEVSHAINAPMRGGKGSLLEGGIRVPTIYHWPGKLPSGLVYKEPVISLDILPTFLAAADVKNPVRTQKIGESMKKAKTRYEVTDGVDLLPYFTGEKGGPPHETLFWRMTLRADAVRAGDWKLLRPNYGFPMLFNLKEDPSELNDLISTEPERAAELMAQLQEWEESLEENPHWISGNTWSAYNRKLYERKFMLKQPEKDDANDYWGFDSLSENVK